MSDQDIACRPLFGEIETGLEIYVILVRVALARLDSTRLSAARYFMRKIGPADRALKELRCQGPCLLEGVASL